MCRIFLLVFCYHVLAQPLSDKAVQRHIREAECCPCPGTADGATGALAAAGETARARSVDDCPCWPRSADSEGAPSLFFPSAVRTDRPLMRSKDVKEDSKNLLEPEVALATSMLDTLRAATEVEYQDALARDAARSVADSDDAVPEESASNVVIIVNPRDFDDDEDIISEPSHVKESRCIHPLGRSVGRMRSSSRPVNILPEPLRFPKVKRPNILHKNVFNTDNDLGASNVEERVTSINGDIPLQSRNLWFKTKPDIRNGVLRNSNVDACDDTPMTKTSSSPNFFNARPNILHNLKLPHIPKMNIDRSFRKPFTDGVLNDNNFAPSNSESVLSEAKDDFSPLFETEKLPFKLKNLLKLRDVELIPKYNRKSSISKSTGITTLPLQTFLKNNNEDIKAKDECNDIGNKKNAQKMEKSQNLLNPKILPKNKDDHFNSNSRLDTLESNEQGISDVLPSPSEIQSTSVADSGTNNHIIETASNTKKFKPQHVMSPSINTEDNNNGAELRGSDNTNNINDDQILEITNSHNNEEIEAREPEVEPILSEEACINRDLTTSKTASKESPLQTQDRYISPSQSLKSDDSDVEAACIEENTFRNTENGLKTPADTKDPLSSEKFPRLKTVPALSETLSNIRENVAKGLDKLRKSSSSDILNKSKEREVNDRNKSIANFHNSGSTNKKTSLLTEGPEARDSTNDISMDDLQNMSNKLLDLDKITNHEDNPDIRSKDKFGNDNMKSDSNANMGNKISFREKSESRKQIDCLENNEQFHLRNTDTVSLEENSSKMEAKASDAVSTTVPVNNMTSTESRNTQSDLSSVGMKCNEESLVDAMTPAASTSSQWKIPSLRPIEEFDTDLFQSRPLKPLSINSLSKEPKFNLNSYRAKIPIPNNLELKPLKLDSRIGEKITNGIRSFDPDMKIFQPKHSINNLVGDHFKGNNALNELTKSARTNAKNLLHSPELFRENLHSNSASDIAENIRQNTEKTIKGLQRKMKSTIRKVKTTNAPLSDTFGSPQEMLDDMNDKLKAIHYDLNHRLSSFRDNSLDSSGFNTLADRNVITQLLQNKARPIPIRLRTPANTFLSKDDDSQRTVEHKDRKTSNSRLNTPRIKSQRLHEAESSPPVMIEPRHEARNPTFPNLQKTYYHPLKQIPALRESIGREQPRFGDLRSSVNPFQAQRKPNKVTFSFETTTKKPAPQIRPLTSTHSVLNRPNTAVSTRVNGQAARDLDSLLNRKLTSLRDTRLSPSEFRPLRISPPFTASQSSESDMGRQDSSHKNSKFKQSQLKTRYFSESAPRNSNANRFKTASSFKDSEELNSEEPRTSVINSPAWSKVTEPLFLSKVRGAVDKRIPKQPIFNKSSIELDSNESMLRSATDNRQTLAEEPMKENVSYRCRMVCTKEFN